MIALPEDCDKCGRKGRVIRSKKRKGYRRRRRQCPFCRHEWNEFSSRINPGRVIRSINRRRATSTTSK